MRTAAHPMRSVTACARSRDKMRWFANRENRMRALVLVLALAPALANAERVALLPATGSNVHAEHLVAATDVFRAHLERTGRFQVAIVPSPAPAGVEASFAQAAEAARVAGADLAVTLRVSRLGSNALVRMGAYRPDGSVAHVDELSAATPEDLDPVLQRLAKGFAEGRPARTVAEVDTVTQKEADPYKKMQATNVFGLRLGGGMIFNRAGTDEDSGTVAGGGLFWLYDARSYLAEVALDFMGGEGGHVFSIGLGAYYPFTRGNTSPYLGGGLAYSFLETGGDGGAGLALRAGGGVLFGRLSSVQIRADVAFVVNTFSEETDPAGDSVRPYGVVGTIGIGF